jgi:YidC/Oxa1 family membrane protein insertase
LIHLDYLYTAVSWVLLRWHQLFSLFLNKNSGLNWSLSIVMLVVTARLLLFRLFIKQVHYQRRMQEMAPKMNAIKLKYKDDKQAQQRETMKMQQEEGFNPLSGCLPMFLQFPVFICLFHVLRHLSNSVTIANKVQLNGSGSVTSAQLKKLTLYSFSQSETISAAKAKLFGAPLAASFHDSATVIGNLGGHAAHTRLVILPLVLISALATFATQLLVRSNATTVPTGTSATVQKAMLYLFPLGVVASGLIFNFPLGVLLYWFSSNLWTLGQQAYIIRFHPPTEAVVTGSSSEVGKTLAPRPGQKPDYERARQDKALPAPAEDKTAATESDVAPPAASTPPRPPRPRQGPARPGTNRPAAKRPSQAKKRR